MSDFFESQSFVLPSEVHQDVINRFKETKGIRSLELELKGEALENTGEFSKILLALKKRGVKISHNLSIRLTFPRDISRGMTLALVESMPRSKNGTHKVRIELTGSKKKAK